MTITTTTEFTDLHSAASADVESVRVPADTPAGAASETPLDEALIEAAGRRDADVGSLIAEAGFPACAAALLAEVVSRCEPPALEQPVPVGLRLRHGPDTAEYVLDVSSTGVRLAGPGATPPPATVEADTVALVRALYGPGGYDVHGLCAVHVRSEGFDPAGATRHHRETAPGDLRLVDGPHPVVRAAQAVWAACTSRPADLGDLAIRYGTDKWGAWHWYTRHYERHFAPLRDEPVRVLEIGIGGYADPEAGGGSLRMWQSYFRRGVVHGLDIFDKSPARGPRIRTVVGSQDDPEFLEDYARRHGPFDIVIDDGSHLNEHVLATFAVLFKHVRPGGFYVIEDMQTSYWPQYGGSTGPVAGPKTSVGLVKELIDGLEHREARHPAGYQPSATDLEVVGVHCYQNLAFIEKGWNQDAGIPAWIRRAPVEFFYGGGDRGPR